MILHFDADAFFASAEQAADKKLRGHPVAVGGERRGIIASASYEARKLGIYTPMPTARARKLCPGLIVLPCHFDLYERLSRLMFSYAYDFTPLVEQASIDECYLDLHGAKQTKASEAGEKMQRAIAQSLKLSVSVGVGANKLVSQIASKLRKPHCFIEVERGHEQGFLWPLENKWLPAVGPHLAAKLDTAGLRKVEHIARTPVDELALLVGKSAPTLRDYAQGLDSRPVICDAPAAKSYGEQETFAQDTTDNVFITARLRAMADKLMSRVREDHKSIRTVTLTLRYNDMDEVTRSTSLDEPTDLENDVYPLLHSLLTRAWERRVSVRLIGLRLSKVHDARFTSVLALEPCDVKREKLHVIAGLIDTLRHENRSIMRGHDLWLAQHRNAPRETLPKVKLVSEACAPVTNRVLRERPNGSANAAEDLRNHGAGDASALTPFPLPQGEGEHAGMQRKPLAKPSTAGIVGTAFATELGVTSTCSPSPSGLRSREAKGEGVRESSLAPRSISKHQSSSPTRIAPALNIKSAFSFQDSALTIPQIIAAAAAYDIPALAITDRNLHAAVPFFQAATAAGIQPIIAAELCCDERPMLAYVQNTRGYQQLCRLLSINNKACITAEQLHAHREGLLIVPADSADVALPEIRYHRPSDKPLFDVLQSMKTLTLLHESHPQKRRGDFAFHPPTAWRGRYSDQALRAAQDIAAQCHFAFDFKTLRFPRYTPADGSTPAAMLYQLAHAGLRDRYGSRAPQHQAQLREELSIIAEVGYEEYFLTVWHLLQECAAQGIGWITRGSAADSLVCYSLGISNVCPIRFELYFKRFLNRDRMALQKLPDIDIDFAHDRKDDVVNLLLNRYGPEHAAIVGGFNTFQARAAFGDVAKVLGVAENEIRRLTEHMPWTDARHAADAVAVSRECDHLAWQEEPMRTALLMAGQLDGFPRYAKMHPCGVVLSRDPIRDQTPTFISGKGWSTTHFDMDAVEAVGLIKLDILAQGGLAVLRDTQAALREQGLTLDLRSLEVGGVGGAEGKRDKVKGIRGGVGGIRNKEQGTRRESEEEGGEDYDGQGQLSSDAPIQPSSFNLHPSPDSPLTPFTLSLLPSVPSPWSDPHVWHMIATGNARGVHHIESPAMTSLACMADVRDIDRLVAIVSVIRPGAANGLKKAQFARRAQGLEPTHFLHPSLAPVLRTTFGVVAYEEHILQICEAFAGLDPGRADILRRALVKQDQGKIAAIRVEFIAAARARQHAEKTIDAVWELIAGFQGYAFCRAHSTAYAVEAYQGAYAKCYHPAEFMAAVLSNGKGFYSALVYTLECRRLGIGFLLPDVNNASDAFEVSHPSANAAASSSSAYSAGGGQSTPQGQRSVTSRVGVGGGALKAIRVPLRSIKDLSAAFLTRWRKALAQAPFTSVRDFCQRARPESTEALNLIRCGAFDSLGGTRTEHFWHCLHSLRDASTGTDWLFNGSTEEQLRATFREEPTALQRLQEEKELLGYTVTGHPLDLYPQVAWQTYCPINELHRYPNEVVTVCGLIIVSRSHMQENGLPMKFISLCDYTGIVECEIFAAAYAISGLATVRYPVVQVTAEVKPFDNGQGCTLDVIRIEQARQQL